MHLSEDDVSHIVQEAIYSRSTPDPELFFVFENRPSSQRFATHVFVKYCSGVIENYQRTPVEPILPGRTVDDIADMLIKYHPKAALVCQRSVADGLFKNSMVLPESNHWLVGRFNPRQDGVRGMLKVYVWS